ncbi:MAG: hypothetical protein Q4E08_08500 [Clostridium sp.]|nr:hypothetical protein [Clostridium sp.]
MEFILILLFQIIVIIFMLLSIIFNLIKIIKGKISKKYFILIFILLISSKITLFNIILPKVKDIKYYFANDYYTTTGVCTKFNNVKGITELEINNVIYKINQCELKPKIGVEYTLKYLPNSKFIVEYSELKNKSDNK